MIPENTELRDAALDAVVHRAVIYNRYRGITSDEIKSFADLRMAMAGVQSLGEVSDDQIDGSLSRLAAAKSIIRVGTRWLLPWDALRETTGKARPPEFKSEDSLVLFSIVSQGDKPLNLVDIIAGVDLINHAIPTVDELHGALNRLHAARLIATRRGRFVATSKACELRHKVNQACGTRLWDQVHGLTNMLKCPCCGVRLKRVAWRIEITNEEIANAYREYHTWFSKVKVR